jgi:hypothetical protein
VQHVSIPEPHHRKAASAQIVVPCCVIRLRQIGAVTVPIDLNNQSRMEAGKVDVIGPNQMLAAEIPAGLAEWMGDPPEGLFRRRELASELPG